MSTNGEAADLPLVDNAERGEAIRRRRMALGIRSVSELAARTGVSRSAASAAEHGGGARGTYERLEAWLSEQERNGLSAPPSDGVEQIEFTVEGDFGVKVTVKGPISDRAALEDSVAKIVRSIRDTGSESPAP
jgi:transcriptional regulator with XRE-family HTH domain